MKKFLYFASAAAFVLTVGLSSCGKSKETQVVDENAAPSMYEIDEATYMIDEPGMEEMTTESGNYNSSGSTSAGSSSSSSSSAAGAYRDAMQEGIDAYHGAIDDAADQLKEAGINSHIVDKAAKDAHKAMDDAESELDNFGDDE